MEFDNNHVSYMVAERSGIVEMEYYISCVAIQNGEVIWKCGNPNMIIPLRSVAKPFMLQPLIKSILKVGLALTQPQIAIITSSHNGEPRHLDVVKSLLDLSNSSANDLNCGTHIPFFEWLYDNYYKVSDKFTRQLFHNCSGKHSGMLLLCKLLGETKSEYWLPTHPIQKLITESVKNFFVKYNDDVFSLGVDGCGVPTYNVKLAQLARAYSEYFENQELKIIKEAIINEPYFIAGKDRLDTLLIETTGYIAKSGSDGLFCISCPNNIGISLKVESGSEDASESAIIEVLNNLGLLNKTQLSKLDIYRKHPIKTTTGIEVGCFRFCDKNDNKLEGNI